MARSPYPPINLLLATCQPAGHTLAAVHEDLGGVRTRTGWIRVKRGAGIGLNSTPSQGQLRPDLLPTSERRRTPSRSRFTAPGSDHTGGGEEHGNIWRLIRAHVKGHHSK